MRGEMGWQKSGRGRKHSGRGSRAGEQLSLQGSSGHKIHDKIRKSEHAHSTGHGLEQKEEGQPASRVRTQICQNHREGKGGSCSFSDFKEEHNLDQEPYSKRVYAPGCTEGLRVDIENITVTLLRRKQDLYRQHDSNQARQRKRKRMRELKKKLREKVVQYNTGVQEEQIDEELACSLTEATSYHGRGMQMATPSG
ncbi:hypothetical protein CesoFtcFv8_001479 [Champsocephalus esox]|uniref:Uncharacterized protein n=1 Tax=Champsocephalus esox TaxID=159716 RepID=A0AAN8D611_9TELE|nr:hypothetical protein CesoFtcFv8_001479 [Champsocephalus esox]